jgi:hypothetical protein
MIVNTADHKVLYHLRHDAWVLGQWKQVRKKFLRHLVAVIAASHSLHYERATRIVMPYRNDKAWLNWAMASARLLPVQFRRLSVVTNKGKGSLWTVAVDVNGLQEPIADILKGAGASRISYWRYASGEPVASKPRPGDGRRWRRWHKWQRSRVTMVVDEVL